MFCVIVFRVCPPSVPYGDALDDGLLGGGDGSLGAIDLHVDHALLHPLHHSGKDLVLLLVPTEIKDNVLHAIYKNAGLKTAGQGIAFSVAVNDAVGLNKMASTEDPEKEK